MGTWNDQLFTLATATVLAEAGRGVLAEARAVASFLRGLASAGATGGTLYVPRRDGFTDGAWVVDVTGGLVVPEGIEVLFAPGARLIPVLFGPPSIRADGTSDDPWLELRGTIRASLLTIFGVPSTGVRMRPELVDVRARVMPVRVTGPAQGSVVPEWWGARGDDPRLDTAALQEAIRAAHGDRRLGTRWLRPLAVELSGSYRLVAPLRVGAGAEVNPDVFELRGGAAPRSSPHLRCEPGAFTGDAMLIVEGGAGVHLDDVHLDGGGEAARCVSIRGIPAGIGVDEQGHRVSRGALRGAAECLLELRAGGGSGGAAEALVIEGTRFEAAWSSPLSRTAALRLALGPDDGVHVRSATFVGDASAMVHATGCTLSLSHCYFHNSSLPDAGADPLTRHDAGPVGGLDVFLGSGPDRAAASVSVMHCLSHSLQFLAAGGDATGGRARDSIVTALRHEVGRDTDTDGLIVLGPYERPWQVDVIPPDPVRFAPHLLAARPVLPEGVIDLRAPRFEPVKEGGLVPPSPIGPLESKALVRAGTPIPPAIVWNGAAVAGTGLTLCGCRFERPTGSGVSASVVALQQGRPVVDLGVSATIRGAPTEPFADTTVDRPEEVTLRVRGDG